ncbi:hypothetical protein [Glaciecola sp. KUL10]|uniref:hypothetical protein n=1 Tax=Glaciecola sp. (strain KUL10) TaxID=2161813 RepID=UPI000D782B56|nr:hypothetical protein [Glaciecola sp. KUL10]GBL04304.1 hypothetical protein KUL10_16100 [Glaciecola sp. KUL10]
MKQFKLFIASAIMLFGASSANAAFITQTETFAFTPNDQAVLTFDQYDGTQGILTAIEIILQITALGGELTVDNDGVLVNGDTNVELGVTALVSSSLSLVNNALVSIFASPVEASVLTTLTVGPQDTDATDSFQNDLGPDNASITNINVTETGGGFLSSATFASYTGAGTFDMTVDGTTIVDFDTANGLAGSFSPPSLEGFITVNFTTQEPGVLPEPALHAVLGMFALMLAARARRKA